MNERIIIKAFNILQNNRIRYSEKREVMMACFESNSFRDIIDDYEKGIFNINKGKIPYCTFIFYISLSFMFLDDIDDIAEYIKDRPSLKFLTIGTNIFIQLKFRNLKYEVTLRDKSFNNKLEFISRFEGQFLEHGNIFRYVLYLLNIIYEINKDKAIELILKDKQNVFFISFLIEMEVRLDNAGIIKLLSLNDELKVNTVLYYMTRKFRYGVSKYKHSQNEENNKYLESEIRNLYEIFISVDSDKSVYLMVNYIFAEDVFPNFFIDLLKDADINIVVENLQRQDLKNLFKLVNMDFFIKEIGYREIESIFIDNLILFIKENFNINTWKAVSIRILDIVDSLSEESKTNIGNELKEIKANLYISKFDKQVRYIRYNNDIAKKTTIEEIEDIIL